MPLIQNYDYLFKIILIGDSGVGKSSLLLRLVDMEFDPEFNATIGVDFKIKNLSIDDKIYKLQIWDSAGQDRFRSITTMYYRNCDGVILMFDVTDKKSFNNIISWLCEIEKHSKPGIIKILVGSKSDLKYERKVSYEEAREFADNFNISYIETSSKDNKNIEESFILLCKEIRPFYKKIEKDNIKLDTEKSKSCFLCNKCK